MKKDDLSQGLSFLDPVLTEVDDVIFAELVCRAADVADVLDRSSARDAVHIWSRIAALDGDRARMWDLVDLASRKVQSAGIETLPTIEQEYQAYLESLPPAQRVLTQIRYL